MRCARSLSSAGCLASSKSLVTVAFQKLVFNTAAHVCPCFVLSPALSKERIVFAAYGHLFW